MPKEADVSTPSAAYDHLEQLRETPRDLMAGLHKLIEKGETYLPRWPMERPESVPGVGEIDPWKARVGQSRLYNKFQDAVDSLAGKVFAKPPELSEDTPERLVRFADDVDGVGTDLPVFMLSSAIRSVAEGCDFVLVDYPRTPGGLTQAEEERLSMRPFWRSYSPASVIDWDFEPRGGLQRLVGVRLKELITVSDGMWGKAKVKQIRVFYAGNPDAEGDEKFVRWEVYRQNEKKEWVLVDNGLRRPQVDIPLVSVPTDEVRPFFCVPPLLDLAHLNIAHYRKTSLLDNAQSFVGFPVFHWSGVSEDEAKEQLAGGWGSSRFFISPDPQGRAGFVEPEGTSWDSIDKALERMEDQMDAMASDPMMQERSGNVTATGEAIRSSRTSSKLASWVGRWEDAFDALLRYTAIDMKLVSTDAESGWGSVKLNRAFFPTDRNQEGARIAHERNLAGKLSDETTYEILQRSEIVPETVEFAEEMSRLRKDAPALGLLGREEEDAEAEE